MKFDESENSYTAKNPRTRFRPWGPEYRPVSGCNCPRPAYILETTARFSTYIHVLNTARKYGLYSACTTHVLLTACAASVCACAERDVA